MSSIEAAVNREAFQRFLDAIDTRDLQVIVDAVDACMTPDARFHTPAGPAPARPAQRAVWSGLLQAFPDIHVSIDDMIAEGDRVASRQTVTGTHLGDFQGIRATGRKVVYQEIFIARFVDGLIAELWGVVDMLSLLQQVGAIPAGVPGVPASPGGSEESA
ncbi:ester cyclase [Microbacterium sp. ASV49]|uniref:Ester cyclase n=1 Tax=Microbacterium candidum TaxID=3041922 RepID=A0ABT7N0D3_9MICO|nr:ester cyclase [Microbacterium sp. ASV49]MDL9980168.1 ester cyclase [Microbacterium sp. ASV49]